MATLRHRNVTTVLITSALLLAGSAAPANASSRPVLRGVSTGSAVVAAERPAAQRSAQRTPTRPPVAKAGTRAATIRARATAARAAARAAAKPAALPLPVVGAAPVAVPDPLAYSPSGVAAPRGDLPGWRQTYVEDFKTDVATGSFPGFYSKHWGAYEDGWKDTSKNGTYMPSKVLSVHDGVLDYSLRTENGLHMVSAPWLKDTSGQTYGRYSVRFRADQLPGYKTAWLLWPDSERWPDDGEIDFPEGNLDSTISGFAHHASAAGTQDVFDTSATFASWHTATIEWLPGKVTFVLDGKVLGSSTKNVPATAMHWVLQTETRISKAAPNPNVEGHVLVDWVALYQRA
jgi:hypothetical protein